MKKILIAFIIIVLGACKKKDDTEYEPKSLTKWKVVTYEPIPQSHLTYKLNGQRFWSEQFKVTPGSGAALIEGIFETQSISISIPIDAMIGSTYTNGVSFEGPGGKYIESCNNNTAIFITDRKGDTIWGTFSSKLGLSDPRPNYNCKFHHDLTEGFFIIKL